MNELKQHLETTLEILESNTMEDLYDGSFRDRNFDEFSKISRIYHTQQGEIKAIKKVLRLIN